MLGLLTKFRRIKRYYKWGERLLTNSYQLNIQKLSEKEWLKRPLRSDVLNFLLNQVANEEPVYLEIGVRNPDNNFNKIEALKKYSVDPGVEYEKNPVDFKMTSDEFFNALRTGTILDPNIKFDVIFIDGLHIAEQVERDISNALNYLADDGFIVLHDCNPPSEWHAREEYRYHLSPARIFWNGTTWKAFYRFRQRADLTSACIDTDWGVGILSRRRIFNYLPGSDNPFYEYQVLDKNRSVHLNLMSFDELKNTFQQASP
jgi:antitoxin component of RelBE/YafQ-DinJ toxin-antitoxin module